MTETAVKPVIFAFSLAYVLDKESIIQHKLFVKPNRECGEEVPNIGQKKDLGVIAFSACPYPQSLDNKELWFKGKPSLSAYRANVERVWDSLYSFLREQEHLAMRKPVWFENPNDYCPVSITGVDYFHRFKARINSELVPCLPAGVVEIFSDMPDLKSYAKIFGNHRKSSA